MENVKRKVLIIGGGASGLMAAIMAAREGAEVTILEHMDRVGKKILSTGNGRCNLTNLSLKPEHYRSSQKLFPMKVLDRFAVWDTLSFFDGIGIITRNRNGYIYPNSDQAASVLDALRFETEHLGIKTVLSMPSDHGSEHILCWKDFVGIRLHIPSESWRSASFSGQQRCLRS